MPFDQSLELWSALRPALKYMEVFNSENLHGKPKSVFYNICKMFGFALILLVIPMTMLFGVWHCVNHGFRLVETAMPMSVILYCTQIYLVYLSFLIKNRQITAVLVRMQELINKSKDFFSRIT